MTATVDAAWIRRVAQHEDYDADSFERAYRLAQVLHAIGEDDWLAPRLVLKGGTCINFFHAPLPRLSVDMDLNYVGILDREEMTLERPEVEKRLHELASEMGYNVGNAGGNYIMHRFVMRYRNTSGSHDSIKVDVNFLMRLALYGVENRDLPTLFDLEPAAVPCWTREEVYGSKLKALSVRGEARDLFDAHVLFARGGTTDAVKLRKALLFYAHMDDAAMATVDLTHVERITEKDLTQRLYPMLRSHDRPSAAEMREVVLPKLREMIVLAEEEKAFGARLLAKSYEPDLLFRGVRVAEGIERHPAGLRRASRHRAAPDEKTE